MADLRRTGGEWHIWIQPADVHSHILASVGRGAHHSQIRNPARLSVVAMLFGPAAVGCLANKATLHARVTSIIKDCNGMGSEDDVQNK